MLWSLLVSRRLVPLLPVSQSSLRKWARSQPSVGKYRGCLGYLDCIFRYLGRGHRK